jgi:hypothetical protein
MLENDCGMKQKIVIVFSGNSFFPKILPATVPAGSDSSGRLNNYSAGYGCFFTEYPGFFDND